MKKEVIKQIFVLYGTFALIMITSLLLNEYMPPIDVESNTFFVSSAGYWVLWAMLIKLLVKKIRRDKWIERDERTNKLAYYALSWSWLIALLTSCAFVFIAGFGELKLDWIQITTIFFVELLLTWILMQVYFYRKWDINI